MKYKVTKVDPKCLTDCFQSAELCPASLAPRLWILSREYAKNGSNVKKYSSRETTGIFSGSRFTAA